MFFIQSTCPSLLQSSAVSSFTPSVSPIRSATVLFSTHASKPRAARRHFSTSSPNMSTAGSSTAKISVDTSVATSTLESTKDAVTEAVNTAKQELTSTPEVAIILSTTDREVSEIQTLLCDLLPATCAIHAATSCQATLSNAGPAVKGVSVLLMGNTQGAASVSCGRYDPSSGSVEDFAASISNAAVSKLKESVANLLIFATPGLEEGMLRGMKAAHPTANVFGGSAADNEVSGGWSVYDAQTSFDSGVSVLALSSGVDFAASLVPPYDATAESATVTKCAGRVVHELDGRPAIDVINGWVTDDRFSKGGNIIVESATFPLGVQRGTTGQYIGVHAAEVTADGSVGLFAEVQQGDRLTLMKGTTGTEGNPVAYANAGLNKAYDTATEQLTGSPKTGIVIYCGGLSIAVGDGLADSLQGLQDKVPVLGMTAFGEQGCLDAGTCAHSNLAVGVGLFA